MTSSILSILPSSFPSTNPFWLLACIALLSSVGNSDYRISTETVNKFPTYDYNWTKGDNEKNESRFLDLTDGEWIFFPLGARLEFHPTTPLMVIFKGMSTVTDSDFFYLEKDKRVLIYEMNQNGDLPYVGPSQRHWIFEDKRLEPRWIFPFEDMTEKTLESVNNAFGVRNSKTFKRFPVPVDTSWKSLPFYHLPRGEITAKVNWSNHCWRLLAFPEEMRRHLSPSVSFMSNPLEVLTEDDKERFKYKLLTRLMKYIRMNDADYLQPIRADDKAKTARDMKMNVSAWEQVPNVTVDQSDVDKIFAEMATLANMVAAEYVFSNDSDFIRMVFHSFAEGVFLTDIMEDLKAHRQLARVDSLALQMNRRAIGLTVRKMQSSSDLQKVFTEARQKIEVAIFAIIHQSFNSLAQQQIDPEKGNEYITQFREAYPPETASQQLLDDALLKVLDDPVEPVYEEGMKAALKQNLKGQVLNDLILDLLCDSLLGEMLGHYEDAFFNNMGGTDTMKKMLVSFKVSTKKSNADWVQENWLRRLFMVMGVAGFNYDLDFDPEFLKQKELQVFESAGSRRLMVI